MPRVTSTEFQQNVGAYSDTALREPVIITNHNRDRLVLIGMDTFNRLKALETETDKETEQLISASINAHRSTLEKLAQK